MKEKLGPLPLWAWLAIVTVLGLAYYLYEQHVAGSSSSTSSTGNLVPQSGIPQFVIQNQYPTQVTGPAPPASGPPPAAGGGSGTGGSKNPATGLAEVSEAEARTYRAHGAKILADKGNKFGPWGGPGSAPGARLFVSNQWLAKHHGHSGKSGPGAPTKVTGPEVGKAPHKPAAHEPAKKKRRGHPHLAKR